MKNKKNQNRQPQHRAITQYHLFFFCQINMQLCYETRRQGSSKFSLFRKKKLLLSHKYPADVLITLENGNEEVRYETRSFLGLCRVVATFPQQITLNPRILKLLLMYKKRSVSRLMSLRVRVMLVRLKHAMNE